MNKPKEKKYTVKKETIYIPNGEIMGCPICGISSFAHIHKVNTLPGDFERIVPPPQEAEEWEVALETMFRSWSWFKDKALQVVVKENFRQLLLQQKKKDRQSFTEALGEMETTGHNSKRYHQYADARNAFRQEVLTKLKEE